MSDNLYFFNVVLEETCNIFPYALWVVLYAFPRGQIYMGAPIGGVEIHLRAKLLTPPPPPPLLCHWFPHDRKAYTTSFDIPSGAGDSSVVVSTHMALWVTGSIPPGGPTQTVVWCIQKTHFCLSERESQFSIETWIITRCFM